MLPTSESVERVATFTIEGGSGDILTSNLLADLNQALIEFDGNPELRAFALLGASGSSYSSSTSDEVSARRWRPLHRPAKPVIAALRGECRGLGLVVIGSVTDIRVAGEGARFGFGPPRLRVNANWATASRLHSQLPHTTLMHLLLTGESIDAREALRTGLVNRVVPDDDALPTALAIARSIAEIAPAAVRADKLGMVEAPYLSFDDALFFGSALATLNRLGPDMKEGVAAFVEKRKPRFKGM